MIDWNVAVFDNDDRKYSFSGSPLYMSKERIFAKLLGKTYQYEARDDFESLFWTMIELLLEGTHKTRPSWYRIEGDQVSLQTMVILRTGTVCDDDGWNTFMNQYFYLHDISIQNLINNLRKKFFIDKEDFEL